MIAVRRLYVYLMCAVSLLVLAIGLANLLDLAVSQLWASVSGSDTIMADDLNVRREVSLYLALVAVSLPIWLVHWYLAGRWSALQRIDNDRASGTRAIYFALVLGVAIGVWASNLGTMVNASLDRLFSTDSLFSDSSVASAGSIFAVGFAFWAYHAWVRDADMRSITLSGDGVWPTRLYLYAAAFAGGMLLLIGVSELLTLSIDAMVGDASLIADDTWWASGVSSGLSLVVVGGLVWSSHWYYSLHLLHGDDWRAESEQGSALRRTYLYLVVLSGIVVTLGALSVSLTEVLRWGFGVDPAADADPLWARVLHPLVLALPFALFWGLHQQLIREEAARFADEARQVAVARLYNYVVSFLSLVFMAIGLAYLLGVLIEFLFESAEILSVDPEWIPEQISQFLSLTVIGAIVWFWHWAKVQRAVSENPSAERSATSRRVYLYLILAVSTLATLVALAVVFYQALQVMLGVRTTEGIASDVGALIGIVLVAGALLAYHLAILRGDLGHEARLKRPLSGPPRGPRRAVARVPQMIVRFQGVSLMMFGPKGTDFEAIIADLRPQLPDGVDLQIVTDEQSQSADTGSGDAPGQETVGYDTSGRGETDQHTDSWQIPR